MSEYLKSDQHKKNYTNSFCLGSKKLIELCNERKNQYYSNPILCSNCNEPIEYKKKNNKFCNRSCSATYNNLRRPSKSIETRSKISIANKNRIITPDLLKVYQQTADHMKVKRKIIYYSKPKRCNICNEIILYDRRTRLTCSRQCNIIASTQRTYQNGSKKYFYYKGIALESSWELNVAKLLDSLNIKWSRPHPMHYIDQKNKSRIYYPDFHLTDYDIFLDPKNEYCMRKDAYKMQQIEKQIYIVYGNINKIKEFITSLGVG